MNKQRENQREDRKAFWKMVGFTLLGGVFGTFIGMIAVGTEEKIGQFANLLKAAIGMIAPYGNLFLGTITWIVSVVLIKHAKRIYENWNGEDEDVIDLAERKVTYGICMSSVNLILSFLFFGLGVYDIMLVEQKKSMFFHLLIVFVGYLYSMFVYVVSQKECVNFIKVINPEKKGSVYDTKFRKDWMDSCDESEKLQIYQSGYAAMQTTSHFCMGLWVVCVVGMLNWNFGIMPMVMVIVIWLVLVIRYNIECVRLSAKGC